MQGMAFVAGVILMYLPEEPAFRVLCQLLDGTGVGLRSMYLPGLSGLKEELRMLDWLMERLMPELKQHLEVSLGMACLSVNASVCLSEWSVFVCVAAALVKFLLWVVGCCLTHA